jgi:hypothetical protein
VFHICLEGFIKLIYVKDIGDSLNVLNRQDRICINVRLLKSFLTWLTENKIACENDFDRYRLLLGRGAKVFYRRDSL